LEIEQIHQFFLSKIHTENYINELLTKKWTPKTGFKYPKISRNLVGVIIKGVKQNGPGIFPFRG
jgi:hypothetical protein